MPVDGFLRDLTAFHVSASVRNRVPIIFGLEHVHNPYMLLPEDNEDEDCGKTGLR